MTMPLRLRRSSGRYRPRFDPIPARSRGFWIHAMTDDLPALQQETEAALADATALRAWDAVRVATLGRNSGPTALLRDLEKSPQNQRRELWVTLTRLKHSLTATIEACRVELELS